MSSDAATAGPLRLRLLLFSVGGVRFGADLEQIRAMDDYAGADTELVHWCHELLTFGNREVSYRLPTVLTIAGGTQPQARVVIDAMEDIIECDCGEISPLPPLLEQHLLRQGVWGVLPHDEHLVLLVDFQRLSRTANRTAPPAEPVCQGPHTV